MANLLKGKDVAASINEQSINNVAKLKENNIVPTLAIFRVGEKDSDLSYEKGALKRCEEVGVKVVKYVFNEDVSVDEFYAKLLEANKDNNIHGILVFRPLPKRFDDNFLRNLINVDKDIDGCSDLSLAAIFTNKEKGFAPCTAQAAVEILKYYNIDVTGKNVVVIGRSLVIGKPVSMLLLNKNATVTICHTKTVNIQEITKKADIIICASGQMESINKDYVTNGQTIIDVGISYNEVKQKLCGDALFEEVEPIVDNITPVPGGVGSVTSSILVNHITIAALRTLD